MYGIVAYTFLNVREKIHQLLSSIKKDARKRKLVPFSASRCTSFSWTFLRDLFTSFKIKWQQFLIWFDSIWTCCCSHKVVRIRPKTSPQKKIGSFFLPHGVVAEERLVKTVTDRWRCRRRGRRRQWNATSSAAVVRRRSAVPLRAPTVALSRCTCTPHSNGERKCVDTIGRERERDLLTASK